jgi:plastocyanin
MRSGTNFAITIAILVIVAAIMTLVIYGPLNVTPGRGEPIRSVKTLDNTYTITIRNNTYDPTYLTVLAGTTVTWQNPGTSAQVNSVISDELANGTRLFDSGPLNAGDTFTFTFNEVGNHSYHSGIQYFSNASVNVIPNAPESFVTAQPAGPEGFPTAAFAASAQLWARA